MSTAVLGLCWHGTFVVPLNIKTPHVGSRLAELQIQESLDPAAKVLTGGMGSKEWCFSHGVLAQAHFEAIKNSVLRHFDAKSLQPVEGGH